MGMLLALKTGKEDVAKTFARIQMTHISNKNKRSLRVCSDARVTARIETFSPTVPSPAHLTAARLFHASTFPFSAHGSFKKNLIYMDH